MAEYDNLASDEWIAKAYERVKSREEAERKRLIEDISAAVKEAVKESLSDYKRGYADGWVQGRFVGIPHEFYGPSLEELLEIEKSAIEQVQSEILSMGGLEKKS